MSPAIIAVTSRGARLGTAVAEALKRHGHTAQVYAVPGAAAEAAGVVPLEGPLGQAMGDIFSRHRFIVMIMALGIVVRVIAPHIRDKRADPAVVAMDEGGNFAISVLSGHLGGANDFARLVAGETGATAVITTATDIAGAPAIDVIARDFKLEPEQHSSVKKFNAALARGEKLHVYSEYPLPIPESGFLALMPWEMKGEKSAGLRVLVTGRQHIEATEKDLLLRPRNLVAGVGCKKGVLATDILREIKHSLDIAGRSPVCVRALATINGKTSEQGLIEASDRLGVPLVGFGPGELNEAVEKFGLDKSDFVIEKMGVGGVCEPAAMLASRNGRLLAPKRKSMGITVALAEEGSGWWE
ncbi:MAG: cobalt-precorrin 5A hydrolase [Bacillota bacterium]